MFIETNTRSIVKGISWRFVATSTTVVIVYIFFGRLDLAVFAGVIETLAKIALYYFHEKGWQKIRFGRKRIEPFNLWFTGLPLSGKSTIADAVFEVLQKSDIPLERLDSQDIREVIPNIGFTREDRNRHLLRVGHLIKTLQKNSVSTVCSFVSPYADIREQLRSMTNNMILVHVKADIESCKKRDYKGVYQQAVSGELTHFTGISDVYEVPEKADVEIDTEQLSVDDAVKQIVKFIKQRYLP